MIWNLMIKDCVLQKKTIKLFILVIIILMIAERNLGKGVIYYTVFFCIMLSSTSFAYDDKTRVEVVINSLPIKRWHVVFSRYILLLIFGICSICFLSIISLAVNLVHISFLNIPKVELSDVRNVMLISMLLGSIVIPVYFKVGYIRAKVFNIILYAGFGAGIAFMFTETNASKVLTLFSNVYLQAAVIAGITLIFLLSIFISLRIYENKDL